MERVVCRIQGAGNLQTFKSVGEQVRNELYNNLFDSKTKEYLNLLGLKFTAEGVNFPPLRNSLIRRKVHEPNNTGEKVKTTDKPSCLLSKDEYTDTVIRFEEQLRYFLNYKIPPYIAFLNKDIVYCRGNDMLNLTEHQKINDMDIIRFVDNRTLYVLCIKPWELMVCYAVDYSSLSNKYMIIEKFTGTENGKKLVWATDGNNKFFGAFDIASEGNTFIIYSEDPWVRYEAKGNEINNFWRKIDNTCLWNALNLFRKTVPQQYSKYIAEIFSSLDIAYKIFGKTTKPDDVDSNKGRRYFLKGDKVIVDENDNEIITFYCRAPGRSSSSTREYFDLNLRNTPFHNHLRFVKSITCEIDTTDKTVHAKVYVPILGVGTVNYIFDFSLEKPYPLIRETLSTERFNFYKYKYNKDETVKVEIIHLHFNEEYEREFYKSVVTYLGTAELLSNTEKELGENTYSL